MTVEYSLLLSFFEFCFKSVKNLKTRVKRDGKHILLVQFFRRCSLRGRSSDFIENYPADFDFLLRASQLLRVSPVDGRKRSGYIKSHVN